MKSSSRADWILADVNWFRPIYTFWVFPRPEGSQCFNGTILNTTMGIINCTADFAVVIFPIPFLYRLKLPIYMKLATGFLLCLGFIAAIAGKTAEQTLFVLFDLIPSRCFTSLLYRTGSRNCLRRCYVGILSLMVFCCYWDRFSHC